MRNIDREKLVELVATLCIKSNRILPKYQLELLKKAQETEVTKLGKELLSQILENAELSLESKLPICQDCGMAVVFLKIGRECYLDFDLESAINEGVARGYEQGYLRASMLVSALDRRNTGDNTKAIIHTEIVAGENVKIIIAPKGGGSENASRVAMLTPADGREGIINFVVESVRLKGASACPPLTLGVGLGGTIEHVARLAKFALLEENPSDEFADLEIEITERCNKLGIGVGGFGGSNTVLATHVLSHSCHIATLPVAVNIQCHAARHAGGIL